MERMRTAAGDASKLAVYCATHPQAGGLGRATWPGRTSHAVPDDYSPRHPAPGEKTPSGNIPPWNRKSQENQRTFV